MATLSFDETCQSLGIPDEIKRSYERRGLKNLYPWQVECLNETGALKGNNVVYCAPTGGGKTLVAELVLLKTACALRKKSIFVLPFVSLVLEKHQDIRRILNIYNRSKPKSERISIKSFHGESTFSRRLHEDILICTIEKANSVVNALISRGQISQLGCIIIDEMHVLGDDSRGYHLEILVSKLKYMQLKADAMSKKLRIQIVALSATISNLQIIANWLNAVLYQTSFRPVPLREMIVSGNTIYDCETILEVRPLFSVVAETSQSQDFEKRLQSWSEEMRQILSLCVEGLHNGQQIIVFCSSRNQCQATAKLLSDAMQFFQSLVGCCDELVVEKRKAITEKIDSAVGFNPKSSFESSSAVEKDLPQTILKKSVMHGIAFHHAGLSGSERSLVEKAFHAGILKILTSTSTLAAGVNLPAGRVIIRSLYFGRELITPIQYRQMCGRAGRAGYVEYGESFALTKNLSFERRKANFLSTAPLPRISSQMNPCKDSGRALLRVLLELYALGVCQDTEEIQEYVNQTLVHAECSAESTDGDALRHEMLQEEVKSQVHFLSIAKVIEKEADGTALRKIRVTRFGRAVMESNMNLDEAIVVYEDLLLARSCGLSLESNLHLLYLVAPLTSALVPNFFELCRVIDVARKEERTDMLTLLASVGIGSREEATIFKWTQQPPSYMAMHNASDCLRQLKIERESKGMVGKRKPIGISEYECHLLCKCKRLWTASCLNLLVECGSAYQVADAYSSEGKQLTICDIQNLAQNASVLCYRLVKFCKEIGWPDFERLIDYIKSNLLGDGMGKDHQVLLAVPGMNPKLAQSLVSHGICSVYDLAVADTDAIVRLILLDTKFEIEDELLQESKVGSVDNRFEREGDNVDIDGSVAFDELSHIASNKDEARRLHLRHFVRALIDSARKVLLKYDTDEVQRSETALEVLEGIDMIPGGTDDECEYYSSDGGETDSDSKGNVSTPNTQDELNTSLPDERCGFMYERVDWLQNVEDKKVASISTNFSDKDKWRHDSHHPSTTSPSLASMYCTSFIRKCDDPLANELDSQSSSCLLSSEEITDDVIMSLFDNLENSAGHVTSNKLTSEVPLRSNEKSTRKISSADKIPCATATPHIEHASAYTSPYLFPFTPSKRLSPGRYMYLPQLDESIKPNSAENAIDRICAEFSDRDSGKSSSLWLSIRDTAGCNEFLKQLRGCRAISFELVYSSIPVASSRICHDTRNYVSSASIIKAWSPLISWHPSSCLLPEKSTTLNRKDPADSRVLTGICFCLGGNCGYYLPLPVIPPLLSFSMDDNHSSRNFLFCSVHINKLSEKVQLLICQYVGFTAIFEKCPRLRECLLKDVNRGSNKVSPSPLSTDGRFSLCSPNPLLSVSKLWAARARHALRLDWLSGKCIEWRLCNEIMTSEKITKIAIDIKGKFFSLRERDVLMQGYVEDPQLAHAFLNTEPKLSHQNNDAFFLPVPPAIKLPSGTNCTQSTLDIIKSCSIAVATMHTMAQKERELKASHLFEAFINIEMALCLTVADAERNGIPVNSDFVTQLRQDLHDRNKMIEYLWKSFTEKEINGLSNGEKRNFDLTSTKDVQRVKANISEAITTLVVQSYRNLQMSQIDDLKYNKSSQWSCGKTVSYGQKNMPDISVLPSDCQELTTKLVAKAVECHPLMLLIKEYRSHMRLLPLLHTTLARRYKPFDGKIRNNGLDRVRAVFNTLGTDTGRLIVTNPALQQIPHNCIFSKCERVSLFCELNDAKARGRVAYEQLVQSFNRAQPNAREWVRMTSLASRSSDYSQIIDRKTDDALYHCFDNSVGNVSKHCNGKLVRILDSDITQSVQCMRSGEELNLFEVWTKAGFSYSIEEAIHIPIVVVEIKRQEYFYPADKVYRLLAPLLPNVDETRIIRHAAQSLSQSQATAKNVLKYGKLNSISTLLSRTLRGEHLTSDDFEAFWRNESPDGTYLCSKLEINPRDSFEANEGYLLLSCDYSQIELRILAHFSMDKNLCDAFNDNHQEDIFKSIASKWKRMSISDVTDVHRKRVKQLCYALLYGAGPTKVAADAGCSVGEAEELIKDFLSAYPGISVFMKEVKASCSHLGYVQTMLGRRRSLPHIKHTSRQERARAERQAVNTVCQGSAADLIKLAMINIHFTLCKAFKGRGYYDRRSVPGGGLYSVLDDVRPLLQIHDELIFEVRQDYISEVAKYIRHCMENAVELNVPLQVKIHVGKCFGSLMPFKEDHTVPALCLDGSNQSIVHRKRRRESANLQPNPLLISSDCCETAVNSNSKKRSHHVSTSEQCNPLPVARCIFTDD